MSRSDGILFIRILKNALAVLKKLTTLFSIRVVTHFHTTYIMLPTPRVILSPSMNSHQQLAVGGGELPDVGLVGRGVARASPRAVPRGEAAHVHCAWGSEGSRAGTRKAETGQRRVARRTPDLADGWLLQLGRQRTRAPELLGIQRSVGWSGGKRHTQWKLRSRNVSFTWMKIFRHDCQLSISYKINCIWNYKIKSEFALK